MQQDTSPGEAAYLAWHYSKHAGTRQPFPFTCLTPSEQTCWEAAAKAGADLVASDSAEGLAAASTLEALTQMLWLIDEGLSPAEAYSRVGIEVGCWNPWNRRQRVTRNTHYTNKLDREESSNQTGNNRDDDREICRLEILPTFYLRTNGIKRLTLLLYMHTVD